MNKYIRKIVRDCLEGRNLEYYITIAFIFIIIFLDIFNLASPDILSAITLAVLALVVTSSLSTQESLATLRKELVGSTKVCHSYEEVMSEVARLISNPKNRQADVYVYKAYDISLEREERYFQDTINAIELGYVGRYHRIVTLRSSQEVQNLIAVLKLFSNAEKARLKTKFFINYRPISSYLSFLIVGDDDCFIGFPYLSDAPWEVKGHQSGVFVKDQKIFQSLREVFQTIKQQEESVELLQIPDSECSEYEWQNLSAHIEKKLLSVSARSKT